MGEPLLESRGASLDANDARLVDALRSRGQASHIRLAHRPGDSKPRLWGAIEDSVRLEAIDL